MAWRIQKYMTGEMELRLCFGCKKVSRTLAEKSSSANGWKNGQLITFGGNLLKGAVAGIDHGYADFAQIDPEGTDHGFDRCSLGVLRDPLLEAVIAEVGKEFDSETHARA